MSHNRSWLSERLAESQIALMTLTRLPAGRVADPVPGMASAAWAFPLVGALIGGLGAIGYALALVVNLPTTIAAGAAIAIGIIVSGAMHEDGLADFADGLGGGRDTDAKLAIMRDSQVGSYGVLALVLSLGVRGLSIAELSEPLTVVCAMVALAIASRAAMVLALYAMPPARADGLGLYASQVDLPRSVFASVCALSTLVFLTPFWPLALVAMIAAGSLLAWLAWRHVGGQTGDVLGAIQQGTEIAGWLAVVSWSA